MSKLESPEYADAAVRMLEETGWIKKRSLKKNITEMSDATARAIASGVNTDDIKFLLTRQHLFDSKARFSLDDLRRAYRKLEYEKKLAEQEEIAANILSSWGKRSTVSKTALQKAISVVAQGLLEGAQTEDLKHAFDKRTLLASRKQLTPDMLKRALAQVPADRKAGTEAGDIFKEWYDEWYAGRYTQPPSQIIALIKQTLLNDIDPDSVRKAMHHIGRGQQVVSTHSLQYAIQHAKKVAERRKQAGAHGDLAPESEFSLMEDNTHLRDEGQSPW